MKGIRFETKKIGNKVQVTAIYKGIRLAMEGFNEAEIKEDLAKDISDQVVNKGASE